MRTIFTAIVFFVIGFIVGGGLGINFSLNSAYTSFSKYLENNFSGNIIKVVNNKKTNLSQIFIEQKEKIIKEFKKKKDEIIQNMKEQLKEEIKAKIDEIFGGKKDIAGEMKNK